MLEITVENDVDVLGEPELLVEWSGDTPESLFLSSFDSSFYEYRIVHCISQGFQFRYAVSQRKTTKCEVGG